MNGKPNLGTPTSSSASRTKKRADGDVGAPRDANPALVPKLRFPEFRDAPEWEEKRLGNEGEFLSSLTGKAGEDFDAGEARFVTYMNIFSNTFVDPKALRFVDVKQGENQNAVVRGDVFFTISSETPEEVGMSSVLLEELENCYLNSFCALFRFSESKRLNPVFTGYLLRQPLVRAYFTRKAQGSTRFNLSKDAFRSLPLCVPSPAEQQKIAECLSSVDELIGAESRKLDALKSHKKGLMQQLFPGAPTSLGAPTSSSASRTKKRADGDVGAPRETQPRLRFPEFQNAGEWETSPLSKFILSLDAGVSVNSGGSRPANKAEFGVLKTSAVTNGVFEPEENKVVFAKEEQSRLKEPVCGGTIIISRMNTPALVGANAYVESSHENLFLPDRLWAAKPREGVSMRFLAFILGSDNGRAALSKLAKGSSGSMKNITKPEVLAFSIMAPSPAEQQRIAACLASLDDLIAAQTQKIEVLKTHKKGLMQQLFPSPEEVGA